MRLQSSNFAIAFFVSIQKFFAYNIINAYKGCDIMFFKKLFHKMYGLCLVGFVLGVLMAFFLPPIVIAVIEAVILMILCCFIYFC